MLIVEDDPWNLKLLCDTLKAKGYRTIEAETGRRVDRIALGGGCDEYGRHTPSARAAPAGARLLDLPGDLRRRPARHRGSSQGWPAGYRDIGGGRAARPVPVP